MVTYENLYHLNLKPLESAAEAWQLRHKRLSEAAEDFDRDVVKAVDKAGWEESSQIEETAKSRLSHEHQELEQAGKVAKAVQDNLESAARRLRTKKRALVDLVETYRATPSQRTRNPGSPHRDIHGRRTRRKRTSGSGASTSCWRKRRRSTRTLRRACARTSRTTMTAPSSATTHSPAARPTRARTPTGPPGSPARATT